MKFYKIFLSGLVILTTFFLCQCTRSNARGRIIKSGCSKNVAIIDNQFDAGINIELTIRNESKAGFIRVEATLSSSEGKFSRTQDVYFKENEVKELKFLVHEITINVENPQCFGSVSPEAN